MNNILSFNEYNGQELETMVYEQELNEKNILGGGIRGFFNKKAAGKIRAELADEIEMSKSIMDGIKEGLDSLNENFDDVRKSLDKNDSDKSKGEKQKLLDAIMKILEDSRKNTWDLNQLIDEGEIDYTGFTANVAIASVAYFGILFTPFRAMVMIHKGYNYFFNIVKNTIRKALVMLQLNFDQFENLIITKGFQSDDYQRELETAQEIEGYFKDIETELVGKGGIVSGKKIQEYTKKLQAAKARADEKRKSNKALQSSGNFYNCLDQYNNTYTRSLETLRQYTQEDVQKQLDSIKASMSKLAGQEVDLQTYSELIIAAAEEHAYKVSSSIYNKFAKMTEVFSLPNQKKLIDLINASTEEQLKSVNEAKKKIDDKEIKDKADKFEDEGVELFKKLGGSVSGKLEDDSVHYKDGDFNVDDCTYEKFEELDDDEKDKLDSWLTTHQEILKKLDKRIQVNFNVPFNEVCQDYIDSLIDYISICLISSEPVEESIILSFDDYLFEKKKHRKSIDKKKKSKPSEKPEESGYELSEDEKKDLDDKIKEVKKTLTNLMTLALGEDYMDKDEFTDEDRAKLNYVIKKSKDEDVDDGTIDSLKEYRDEIESKHSISLNLKGLDHSQVEDLKELYEDEDLAITALNVIGKNVLKDNTFAKNSKYIVGRIKKCLDSKKAGLSLMTSVLLANSIKELKDLRNHDYVKVDVDDKSNK